MPSSSPPPALCPELTRFHETSAAGELTAGIAPVAPGIALHSDPALGLRGRYRSPTGRFLELETETSGSGDWVGLHIALPLTDLSGVTYIGLACRHAAPEYWMIRPCLRSGLASGSGFADTFFDKHILTDTRPGTHVDVLYTDAAPDLPLQASWRELVLFLPTKPFRIDLHHLFPFVL